MGADPPNKPTPLKWVVTGLQTFIHATQHRKKHCFSEGKKKDVGDKILPKRSKTGPWMVRHRVRQDAKDLKRCQWV